MRDYMRKGYKTRCRLPEAAWQNIKTGTISSSSRGLSEKPIECSQAAEETHKNEEADEIEGARGSCERQRYQPGLKRPPSCNKQSGQP